MVFWAEGSVRYVLQVGFHHHRPLGLNFRFSVQGSAPHKRAGFLGILLAYGEKR